MSEDPNTDAISDLIIAEHSINKLYTQVTGEISVQIVTEIEGNSSRQEIVEVLSSIGIADHHI